MSKEINNEVMEIKHMAFAVEDIEQSLGYYKDFLGVHPRTFFARLISA